MSSIERCSLPKRALLAAYSRENNHTDCYTTIVSGTVSHAQFVETFYTTWLFKLERLILGVIGRSSTDTQARQLALGETDTFAAWTVEKRAENQVLLCDFRKRTRSWLMVSTESGPGENRTRLYFGSAVVPARDMRGGEMTLGFPYKLLLGFHGVYSIALLSSAKSKLG